MRRFRLWTDESKRSFVTEGAALEAAQDYYASGARDSSVVIHRRNVDGQLETGYIEVFPDGSIDRSGWAS